MESLGKMAFWVSLGKFGENGILGESWKVWRKWYFHVSLGKFVKSGALGESSKVWGKWHFK